MRYHFTLEFCLESHQNSKKRQTQNFLYGLTYPQVHKNPRGYAFIQGGYGYFIWQLTEMADPFLKMA